MFGNIARQLLKMTGHSGTAPGSVTADDLPDHHDHLKTSPVNIYESELSEADSRDSHDENKPVIRLKNRTQPLIELSKPEIDVNHAVSFGTG